MTLQSSSDTHSPHPHQSKDVVQTSGRWPRCAERPAASSSHASVSLCHLWLRYVYVHAAVVLFQAAAPMQGAEAKEKSRQTSCPWEIEKKRVPQAAGSCSRTRNASPTPSGHVSQHVWYVLRPGISEKQRERERYSSMRYFQFLFRHRGCASGSAFTCSHELPPSAGPVLTYLPRYRTVPPSSDLGYRIRGLDFEGEAIFTQETPVVTPSICYPITTYEREFLTVDRINYPEHHSR